MYWNDQSSNIDKLLQEGATLLTILNEDDVLQECIGQNSRLLEFLNDDKNFTEMLSIITSDPTMATNDTERFKHASTVCELLTYESNNFTNIIAKSDQYLCQLWSFVSVANNTPKDESQSQDEQSDSSTHSSAPLNSLLASFFSKIFLYLLTHQIEPVLDFLVSQAEPNDLPSVVLRHINTSAIMDLVFKSWEYINIDKKVAPENIDKFNQLMMQNGFISKLIDTFQDGNADIKQQYAANLISDLIKIGRELLVHNAKDKVDGILEEFEKVETSQTLLQNMLQTRTKHSIVSGLRIIQDLLVYRMQMQQMINQQNEQLSTFSLDDPSAKPGSQDDNMEGMPNFLKTNISSNANDIQFISPQLASPNDIHGEHLSRCVRNVCVALHDRLQDFIDLLVDTANLSPILSTAGVIDPPLGLVRLEVIHLFVALFATSDYSILEKCSQVNVLKILTDLFFQYSLNNQLHKYYEKIIEFLFQNYANFSIIYHKYGASGLLSVNNNAQSEDTSSGSNAVDTNEAPIEEGAAKKSSSHDSVDSSSSNGIITPPNTEKLAHYVKLYEITHVLVKQVIVDCRLIEKIVDSYAQDKVPVKSTQKAEEAVPQPPESTTTDASAETASTEPIGGTVEQTPAAQEDTANPLPSGESENDQELSEQPKSEDTPTTSVEPGEEVAEKPSSEVPEPTDKVNQAQAEPPLKTLRPGYMGHLRLIANVLMERCSDQLLSECNLDSEVLQQWNEFKTGKLSQYNELIKSKLAPESKNDEGHEQDLLQRYQLESVSQALASKIVDLLPSDFEQSALTSLDQQLKIVNCPDFDFDTLWTQTNEKLGDLEKYFDEKCSSIFDDDDGDPFNNTQNADDPLNNSFKRSSLPTQTEKSEFGSLDCPFWNTPDIKEEFNNGSSAGFANFGEMTTDPWAESQTPPADSETAQNQNWSADFANDPFADTDSPLQSSEEAAAGSSHPPTICVKGDGEVQPDDFPSALSPIKSEEEQPSLPPSPPPEQ